MVILRMKSTFFKNQYAKKVTIHAEKAYARVYTITYNKARESKRGILGN